MQHDDVSGDVPEVLGLPHQQIFHEHLPNVKKLCLPPYLQTTPHLVLFLSHCCIFLEATQFLPNAAISSALFKARRAAVARHCFEKMQGERSMK